MRKISPAFALLLACEAPQTFPPTAQARDACPSTAEPGPGIGTLRLQLLGAEEEGVSCRGADLYFEVSGRRVIAAGSDEAKKEGSPGVEYSAELDLPAFQPAGRSRWLLLPPALRTREGRLTELFYDPTVSADHYQSGVYPMPGKAETSKVPLVTLIHEAGADSEAPALLRLEVNQMGSTATAAPGDRVTLSFSISDALSGLALTPTRAVVTSLGPLLSVTSHFGLYDAARRSYLPLWAASSGAQTLEAVVPGGTAEGTYPIYALLRDRAGNSVRMESDGSTASYAPRADVVCPIGLAPRGQPVPVATLQVNRATGVDTTAPLVERVELAGLAPGPDGAPPLVQRCQLLDLAVQVQDERALPQAQVGAVRVGLEKMLVDSKPAEWMTQVLVTSQADRGRLQGSYRVPPSAPAGTYVVLPERAVDGAGNEYLAGSSPALARFCVHSCDGKEAATTAVAAMLLRVRVENAKQEMGGWRVEAGQRPRLSFFYGHADPAKLP